MKTKRLLIKTMSLFLGMTILVACSEKGDDEFGSDPVVPVGTKSLQVTPSKLTFTATGGTQTLQVKTTYPKYGYYFTADWISAGFKDDPTYNYITITAKPNTNPEARSTTVRIDGVDGNGKTVESVNITVEQEGAEGKTYTIPANGGTINEGDISIKFPTGTFDSDTKITVNEKEAGAIRGHDEVSKFYQIKMPAVTHQPMKVTIKSQTAGDDIIMVAHLLGGSKDGKESNYMDWPLDATYKNGEYIAELSPFSNNEDATYMTDITIGLTYSASATHSSNSRSQTRADQGGTLSFKFDWGSKENAKKNANLENTMMNYFKQADKIIKDLGFRVKGNRTVPILIVKEKTNSGPLNKDEQGRYEMSIWGADKGYIYMNEGFSTQPDQDTFSDKKLRCTIIHELMHYFQADYDPRTAFFKGGAINANGNSIVLYEEGGVWAEQFLNNGEFSVSFIADKGRALNVLQGLVTIEDHQSHGYGSSIFLQYMSKKYGNKKIVELYNSWHEKGMLPVFDIYTTWCDKIESNVLKGDNFDNFLVDAATGNIDKLFTTQIFLTKADHEEEVWYTNSDGKKTFSSEVNPYGGSFNIFQIDKSYSDNGNSSLQGKKLKIRQTKSGVTTYIHMYKSQKWELVGKLTNAYEELVMSGDDLEKIRKSVYGTNTHIYFYLTTVNQQNSTKQASEIEISLGDNLTVTPTYVSFEPEGGTQEIKATSIHNKFGFRLSDNDWLKCQAGAGGTFKLTASPNNTSETRWATLTVYVKDDNDKEVATEEVSVVQWATSSGSGDYDFSKCKYIIIEMKIKAHYTGTWESGQNDVNIIVNYPENYWITSNYLEESPSTKTTVSYSGKGAHIECKCETSEAWSWFGEHKLDRYYHVTLDIDDLVSGKITNLTAECNYDYHIDGQWGNTEDNWSKEKMSASNIPLPSNGGSAKGNKSTGTTINSCTRENKQGVAENYKYSMLSSDDYEIVVKFK